MDFQKTSFLINDCDMEIEAMLALSQKERKLPGGEAFCLRFERRLKDFSHFYFLLEYSGLLAVYYSSTHDVAEGYPIDPTV
jgi:hypothetical protein